MQDAEKSQEERPAVLEALKTVITEAFALYMETKSLSWSLACSSFSSVTLMGLFTLRAD